MPTPPPDTDPGSLDATDAHARRVAPAPEVMPPRLPSVPPRRASGRREAVSDRALTEPIERIDPDPAPLPPSPAAEDASRWLERERPRFDAPVEVNESTDKTRPLATPAAPGVRPGHSTAFTVLLAVTSLVIGMVLGALIFGR